MMTRALCLIAVTAFPSFASAQDLTFGGGVTVTSNYLSEGFSDSGGKPAIQPYFEFSKNGFYAGVWASNIMDDAGNTVNLDLNAGYRGEAAPGLSYDLGYTQHLYNKTHDFSAEVTTGLEYALTDKLTLSGELSYDLTEKGLGTTLGASYAMNDKWSLYADAGKPGPGSDAYWDAGVGYTLNDRVSLDLQYQDTAAAKGLVALSVTYAFGETGN